MAKAAEVSKKWVNMVIQSGQHRTPLGATGTWGHLPRFSDKKALQKQQGSEQGVQAVGL
jgi:hypothetical protein